MTGLEQGKAVPKNSLSKYCDKKVQYNQYDKKLSCRIKILDIIFKSTKLHFDFLVV